MLTMMPQGQNRQYAGPVAAPNGAREANVDNYGGPQGGLLGRLLALQAEQSGYQPTQTGKWPSSLTSDPNFTRLARIRNDTPLPMSGSSAPHAIGSAPPPASQQNEADQAQEASEAAAARLVRGVRSRARAEAPPPDPVDIAKSAGIGLVNGVVNALGLPGDALTGFGFLPDSYTPNFAKGIGSDAIRHEMEQLFGEFYKPKSTAGRFAETIGEMTPMVGLGTAVAARHGARAALRELPATLAKHAVAPGVAVQILEEALPDSGAGEALQKGYPVVRRVLPAVLAGKRYYLRRRVAPQ